MTVPVVLPRTNTDDVVAMGWDPGDEHVAVALACRTFAARDEADAGAYRLTPPGWRVYATAEMTPEEFKRFLIANADGIDMIFAESWRLRRDMAMKLVGSDMPTVRLIGWFDGFQQMANPAFQVTWQPSSILTGPTAALLRKAGIRPVSPPGKNRVKGSTGDHQRSAELHLWTGLIQAGLVEGITVC